MKPTILFSTLLTMTLLANGNAAHANTCTVQKHESLWTISKEYHLDFARLKELNRHLRDLNLIYPGQKVNTHHQTGQNIDQNASVGAAGNATAQGLTTQDEQATSDAKATQVLALVNNERAKQGLQPLQLDSKLSKVATEKARDMAVNGYFSHDSPVYGSPFDMMRSFGIDYHSAAENIAAGQRDAAQVMASWMDSSGHRANILSPDYHKIGIGYYNAGSKAPYWVQEFTE